MLYNKRNKYTDPRGDSEDDTDMQYHSGALFGNNTIMS